MKDATIVIRKYANRRLYDTSASRYINLDDLASLVRNGKDVQVIDADSGEDLTRVTLTQIIVEDAKQQPAGLPVELLRQLIVTSDRVGQEFILWYLKSAADAYHKVQDTLQTRLGDMQAAALSPVQTVKNFIQGRSAETLSPTGEDLQKLQQRVADLEACLQAEAAKRPRRSAKKSKKNSAKRAKKN